MKLLITGAAGFLGSHAVEHFLENTDAEIYGLVSFRHHGDSARLQHLTSPRFTTVYHDLNGPIDHAMARRLRDVTHIVNYAAESHVDRSIEEPAPFIQNNVNAVTNMLEFARKLPRLECFMQISTDEVYGPAPANYAHQEWDVMLPSNPYSASKAAQEMIAFSYWRTYGLPLQIVNCMNLIGERQDPEKFLPMLISNINQGERVQIHAQPGALGQWTPGSRFYLHARNLADAVMYIMSHATPVGYKGAVGSKPDKWHVVGEREVNNLQLAQMVAEMMGKPLDYQFEDFHNSRPGHDLRYALDGHKLGYLGWRAPINFEQSLHRTIEWTLAYGKDWMS